MLVLSEIAKLQVSVPGQAVIFAMLFAPGFANPILLSVLKTKGKLASGYF